MNNLIKSKIRSASFMLLAASFLSFNTQASVLINGDFENGELGWNFTETASVQASPFGDGNVAFMTSIETFAVIDQTIAITEGNFTHGDYIEASSLAWFLNPNNEPDLGTALDLSAISNDVPNNPASTYIEIAFRSNNTTTGIESVDFSTQIIGRFNFAGDAVQTLFTGPIQIPETIFNGTEVTTGIRVALAIGAFDQNTNTPSAFIFDNVTLEKVVVSTPASILFFVVGFCMLGMRKLMTNKT